MGFGLLGEHLRHSYSPRIHGELGSYPYALFEVAPADLEQFLLHGDFEGLNVTIPYKKAVLPYCAELSETAIAMGCVNTLLRRPDGTLYGDNTDAAGFSWLLERNGGICAGEKALVLGSGGASGTAQVVLRRFGAEVVEISRKGENNYVNLERHADAVLLVNATPVGMYPDNGASPLDLSRLPNLRCVLDLIYNPARTKLLLDAEQRGLRYENGLSMLVAQAKAAAEQFMDNAIPDSRCEEILCKLSAEMQNLILIGMPGSGKSHIGRLLADALHRPFFDADTELAKEIGSIPNFILTHGEAAFRQKETEVLARLGKESGCVIATGGGCVTREENYPLLHQNGVVIQLLRPLHQLPTAGRPLSQARPVEELWAVRVPLYRRFADITVENTAEPADTVQQILQALSQEVRA